MKAIIFDFDGVIADSEMLSNELLAEALSGIGCPTTAEQAGSRYIGLNWRDTQQLIEQEWQRTLPDGFRDRIKAAYHARLGEVGPVSGVDMFLDRTRHLPRAVASSSPTAWLRASLERFGLLHHFEDRLFSAAEHVSRGKPHPDIYLHAAAALGVAPGACLVIEDTGVGARAAVAAGMQVIGLCAGGHCGDGHGDMLRAAGVERIAADYQEVERLLTELRR